MLLSFFSTHAIFSTLMVFCRIGSSCMLFPGVGETQVPTYIKLLFAVFLSIVIASTGIASELLPESAILMVLLICSEVVIGLAIGLVSKITLTAMHIAGIAISMQIGLSTAMMFDPAQNTQGSVIGNFLGAVTILLIIVMDFHLGLIDTLVNSYKLLEVGSFASEHHNIARLITESTIAAWSIGMQLSIPFMVCGLLMFLGTGILSRLMPQLQMFFLVLPAQILMGFCLLAITLSGLMVWFISHYQEILYNILTF